MVRNNYKSNYTDDDIKYAVSSVLSGEMTIYGAAKRFGIPRKTLSDKIKNKHPNRPGRKLVLTAEEEDELAKWLVDCSEMGDPKLKYEVLKAAAEIAELSGEKGHKFKRNLPSHQWYSSFMKRHPNISVRTPEAISRASAIIRPEDIEKFFDQLFEYLKKTMSEEELDELLNDPTRWGNSDESGFEKNPFPKKVLAKKGAKTVYRVNCSKPKEQITVTYTFLADGHMINPVILFKDSCSKMQDIAFALGSVGAHYGLAQTESGWQTMESFYNFVTIHLNRELNERNIKRPFLYFVDGHKSHLSYKLRKWCNENGIILIAFYPNATHILQMCDTSMFGPLKSGWLKEVQDWKVETENKELDDVNFVKLLKKVNDKYIKKESVINGFASTGIFPFNKKNVHYERCIAKNYDEEIQLDDELENIIENALNYQSNGCEIENTRIQIDNDNIMKASSQDLQQDLNDSGYDVNNNESSDFTENTSVNDSLDEIGYGNLIEKMKLDTDKLSKSVETLYPNIPGFKLNILIIKQQLNILKPTISMIDNLEIIENNQNIDNASKISQKPIEKFLKRPVPPRRTGRRRFKLKTYGVLSSDEAISLIEAEDAKNLKEIEEKELKKKEKQIKKAEEEELKKKIKEMQENLRELKTKGSEKPSVSNKRKANQDKKPIKKKK